MTFRGIITTISDERQVEMSRREHDGSVYVRICQPREDCYLEFQEVKQILREMERRQKS